ncbi:BREX-1 system phosphatase PglZ type A [Saccharibacillus sacchari]|uniref:BREX-1 system phosphatase PglZ type A n=1 Tax=Saccharibacillus sacchari TaxID=456493 RepID=UPI0004B409B2|nr:BREX-1 system phosphatase PglZ type A [Saccharibacillus sacchari]
MLSDTIKSRLVERFAAPLPEFHKRRIVFWHDEDSEFAEAIDELTISDVTLVKLNGKNNFAVKKLLAADDLTGDYLVYDPLSYNKDGKDDWLLDIKLYSEEFRADLVSLQMEELLVEPSSAMRKTMKLYAKFLESKERKAKLRKIGRTYQTPLQLHIDVMAVLCNVPGGSAQDIIIAVLSAGLDKENNTLLANIEKFGNLEAFWQLIQKYTGYVNAEDSPISDLAAHILITALSQTISASVLRGLERYVSDSSKAYCYQLVHEWQRSENNEDLIEICRFVEHELRLSDRFDKIEITGLLKSDTFPAINESILKRFYAEIIQHVIKVDVILEVVENRRTAAWYHLSADYFESLYWIAKLQEFYLAHIEGFHLVEPVKVWKLYTTDAYKMDSYYRHFHYFFGNTLKSPHVLLEDALKKCTDVVEGLYSEWFLKELTLNWTNAIASDLEALGYVSEVNKQREFYRRYVSPNLSKGNRVFIVISDALRFEVAAELSETLGHTTKGVAALEAVQSVFPSITKFGMAALLSGKELSVNEKMEVSVDGSSTSSTVGRGAILSITNPDSVAVTYNDLLQMKQTERRALVQGKEIVYIYHNTIDALGDKHATETKVFEACDSAISELNAIVKVIVNDLSGTNVLITADHGFLYTYKPLEESQKISRQTFNGEIYELGRRYALVDPQATSDYLLPVKTEREISGIPMKGYTPRDIVRIKVQGGGENYVHGGISLQEMVVPVIVYKGMRSGSKKYVEVQNPGLSLISESRKVSNLMFSLDFLQKQPIDDKVQVCNYSLHFTDESGVSVSDTQTVIADRTSDNASERVFRVRFTLKQMQFDRNKIYRLVIANNTDVPEETEFRIDIAFADDFGFDL